MITGQYYRAGHSECIEAVLEYSGQGIKVINGDTCLEQVGLDEVKVASPIPGVASEVVFISGARFVPRDKHHRWQFGQSRLAEKLERSKAVIIGAVIAVPVALYVMFFHLLPAAAQASVHFVPDEVIEQMGSQAFLIIEKTMLDPSELEASVKSDIESDWNNALDTLKLDRERYQLGFYRSDVLGANAFALPNGQIVMTDELAELLKDNRHASLAVLLHEIGHVKHQHSVKMVAQSAGAAIVVAMLFGDLETSSEVLLGTGSVLIESAFSRDMEREADDYALNKLVLLGISPVAFADAMRALAKAHQLELGDGEESSQYLSTHPGISERIEYAEQFTPE
ncbi:M48 family metallopeptidase [Shewanella submarina]|uniref:M48 family metallopeptidase n=1 Tax=Shewanella submarina TaxID=2016376 RepID=A0ABV7GC83_9GAMM|nr:M48 family metallopeptidase [Shewanella submarina]